MNFSPKDIVDIILVTLVIYYGYRLVRQSRAVPILGGVALFLALAQPLKRQQYRVIVAPGQRT